MFFSLSCNSKLTPKSSLRCNLLDFGESFRSQYNYRDTQSDGELDEEEVSSDVGNNQLETNFAWKNISETNLW